MEVLSKRHAAGPQGDFLDATSDVDQWGLSTLGSGAIAPPSTPSLVQDKVPELEGLENRVVQAQEDLALMRENLVATSQGERMPHPHVSVEAMEQTLLSVRQVLDAMIESAVMTSVSLIRYDVLLLRLTVVEEQLAIYKLERETLLTGEEVEPASLVTSVFARQPRVQPFKRRVPKPNEKLHKKQKFQFLYDVTCLQGALNRFEPRAEVEVSLVLLEDTRSKGLRGSHIHMEVLTVEWDETRSTATVAVIFPDGTHVVPAVINVSITGTLVRRDGSRQVVKLEQACHAQPLVVCTNENQWEQAEGRLLRRQVFGHVDPHVKTNPSVPWCCFANRLSEFFLRATRQDLLELSLLRPEVLPAVPVPRRALSAAELRYIRETRFEGAERVTLEQFEAFWSWFGAICHQYRHTASSRALVLSGSIYGLISDQDCAQLLRTEGSFLIRNSDKATRGGEFCIAFVHDNCIKHFKVDPKKIKAPYGNLADFVRSKKELAFLVKPFHEDANGAVISHNVAVEKDAALAEFYSVAKGD